MNPEGLSGVYPHIQHVPCQRCGSMRTVQTDLSPLKQTLQCLDCQHVWERAIPKIGSWTTVFVEWALELSALRAGRAIPVK